MRKQDLLPRQQYLSSELSGYLVYRNDGYPSSVQEVHDLGVASRKARENTDYCR